LASAETGRAVGHDCHLWLVRDDVKWLRGRFLPLRRRCQAQRRTRARQQSGEVGTLRAVALITNGRLGVLAQWQSSGLLIRGFRVRAPGAPPVTAASGLRVYSLWRWRGHVVVTFGFALGAGERLGERIGRGPVVAGQDVRVQPERDGRAGVAETLGDQLWARSGAD